MDRDLRGASKDRTCHCWVTLSLSTYLPSPLGHAKETSPQNPGSGAKTGFVPGLKQGHIEIWQSWAQEVDGGNAMTVLKPQHAIGLPKP